MTDIVLAVPERALTILPGFPPMDRRETHEERSLWEGRDEFTPRLRVEDRSPFESVLPRGIVVHSGHVPQPLNRR